MKHVFYCKLHEKSKTPTVSYKLHLFQSNDKNRLLFVSSTKAVHNTLFNRRNAENVRSTVMHPAVAFRCL